MAFLPAKYDNLLKNKNFHILFVALIALTIRIYYLITTSGQTMWWDEAEYMSAAKHWALGVPYQINEQRPPLFQLLGALFLKLGFEEIALKFILVALPSLALVIATYYLGRELFNHKIGIIASIGVTFVWSVIFWSTRFQPDFFSVTLQLIAFIFFWKLIKHENPRYAIYAGLFVALAFYFKISALLVPLSFALFILYYDGWQAMRKKNYWLILGAFIVGMIPFMIWQAITFGNPLAFAPSYSGDFNIGRDLGWMTLDFFYSFLKLPIFLLFLAGLGITLFNLLISSDVLIKDKSLRKDPWIFSFIVLLVVSLFYIFYIKGVIEDRWVFLIIPFIFFFAGKPLNFIYNKIALHSKVLSALFVLVCLTIFILPQIDHSTALINDKKLTYLPVKEVSLLIKDKSSSEDKVLSVSYTQTTAYAEREVITYAKMTKENFTRILNEERPSFIIASILEPHHPEWIVQQVQNEQGYRGVLFPYFNSTIVISPQNQIVQYDLKSQMVYNGAIFTLIYPLDGNFGGLVAYKIDYNG